MQVWNDNYNQDWYDLNSINKYDVYILIKDALQKKIINLTDEKKYILKKSVNHSLNEYLKKYSSFGAFCEFDKLMQLAKHDYIKFHRSRRIIKSIISIWVIHSLYKPPDINNSSIKGLRYESLLQNFNDKSNFFLVRNIAKA